MIYSGNEARVVCFDLNNRSPKVVIYTTVLLLVSELARQGSETMLSRLCLLQ